MKKSGWLITALLSGAAALCLLPIGLVVLNSFKLRLYITDRPFALPVGPLWAGWENYRAGLLSGGFAGAVGRSAFITVASVGLLTLCGAMTAWYLTRSDSRVSRCLYYLFILSMIVPFQAVMYTMTYTVGRAGLDTVWGLPVVYLGFGAGLTVFMLAGFARSIPRDMEEAATVDGCGPVPCFFRIVLPVMRPTAVTVSILNAMWIWNDYLLPYLVLGSEDKTVPVAIQLAMQGAYGAADYGGLMAMLVLAMVPILVFYAAGQRHIMEGIMAGAVKG